MLIAIARGESELDSIELNAFQERAVAELTTPSSASTGPVRVPLG